jgi:transcriptional regulator with XRE-family HTH domain
MLSSNIAKLRKQHGLTQIEFAKKLHVTQSAVSHWESGRSMPDTTQLFNIAELFGMTVDALTGKEIIEKQSLKTVSANVDVGNGETKTTPDQRRAEAKMLLESMTDEQYQAALQYLKFLKNQEE